MEELNSSELGTKTYWEQAYKKEISNFDEHGDPGDVWFGEDSAMRVINWLCKRDLPNDIPIIDLGCGNGYTLIELAREGFTNLLGVDYCSEAITLAEKVSKSEFPNIRYQVYDILNTPASTLGVFGVIHDKGTYDAISLNPDRPAEKRDAYIQRVTELLDDGGIFVITSCNWTEDELAVHFAPRLRVKCLIPTPQFKFGGKVGNVVSSVVFEK